MNRLIPLLFITFSLFGATTIPSLDQKQTANTVLAGPTSGGTAISSFRTLVAADIPAISLTAGVSGILPVVNGGTGLSSGTSGGVPYYSASGTIASSAALTQYGLVIGGGAGAAPYYLGSLGTTTQVLHGNASGNPSYSQIVNADITNSTIDLTAKVTGILPAANGGTGSQYFAISGPTAARTYTFPDSSTTILTTANLITVAQGGTGLSSGTSGGIPYYSNTTTIASSAVLTLHGVVLGQGAGASPTTTAAGTNNTVLHGNSGGDPTFSAVALGSDVSGTLGIGNGGTGQTTASAAFNALAPATAAGGLILGSGTNAYTNLAIGANGNVLTISGGSVVWGSSTGQTANSPLVLNGSVLNLGTNLTNVANAAVIPTTLDANASVSWMSSSASKKPLVLETQASNTATAFEIQNNSGTAQYKFDNSTTSQEDITETLGTAHTSSIQMASITELMTIANTATSTSSTNLLPANAYIIGVAYRVTTAITCTSTFSIGDTISASRFGSGISKALNTISTSFKATTMPFFNTTATTIKVTPDTTPSDSTGRIRITVYYYTLTEPGS